MILPTAIRCLHNLIHQKHHVLCVCLSRLKHDGFESCLFDCSVLHEIQTLAASPLITTCYQPANKTDKADSMSSELTAPPPTPPSPPVSLSKHETHRHTHTQAHTYLLSEAGEHCERSTTRQYKWGAWGGGGQRWSRSACVTGCFGKTLSV